MNIVFEYPWLMLMIIFPYFVRRFLPDYLQPHLSIYIPFFQRIVEATEQTPSSGAITHRRRLIQSIALIACWLGLIVSLARPVLLGEVEVTQKTGRDLMVAVDLSQSMEQKDYFIEGQSQAISRMDALKHVLNDFADERQGDRLGLIVFGSGAYLQVPFTEDIVLWQSLLNEMETQMAGPATAIGDAIGLSIRAFESSETKQRLLLLVTDGSDTHSRLDAVDAARVAASENIQIMTLGLGDPKTQGDDKVDFNSLQKIAKVSGGNMYIAADSNNLQKVLEDINNIVPAHYDQQVFQPKQDLYPWIMGPLLCFYLLVWACLSLQSSGWLRYKWGQHAE